MDEKMDDKKINKIDEEEVLAAEDRVAGVLALAGPPPTRSLHQGNITLLMSAMVSLALFRTRDLPAG